MNIKTILKDLTEKCAEIEHTRWANWQNYLHSKLDFSTGKYVLSESDFEHWNRQIHTPYSELSEKEKESDRDQVKMYLPVVLTSLLSVLKELEKEIPEDEEHEFKVYKIDDIVKEAINQERQRQRTSLTSRIEEIEGLLDKDPTPESPCCSAGIIDGRCGDCRELVD